MDSVIEVQRQTHEEIERFERALSTILSYPQSTHEGRLQVEHKAAQILDRVTARANTLEASYANEGSRKAEIDALSAPAGNQNDLAEFYSRLVKIQEHYNKYPNAVAGGFELELAAFLDEPEQGLDEEVEDEDPISLLFSGEEGYGKYLDVYANHTSYNNMKHIDKRLGYLQYLDVLLAAEHGPVHRELPKDVKKGKDFETYIQALYTYLISFTKRTQPLTDIEGQQRDAGLEFNQKWEEGVLEGWEDIVAEPSVDGEGTGAHGIWCAACQKMYAKQTVYDAHLTSKKHVKATQKQASATAPPSNTPNGPANSLVPTQQVTSAKTKYRTAALTTYLATALLKNLLPAISDTKANVERRFSLTAREREQELLEQRTRPAPAATRTDTVAEVEEEEEERIYNPLKLPLGWDGKPIPYWLYKLHGLGVEYRCEICSDHIYMGRKNFERHFQESRHAFGMRALGLPNTKHFHEITKIADALSLAERLKKEGRHEIFEQETMEELEDDEGNVYNRKTYDDLKKQGLI